MASKWRDPNSQEYWNLLLKNEGLGVVKKRQVFRRRRRAVPVAAASRGKKRT